MKRFQIPQKLVYEKFYVHEKILPTRNCRGKLIKIYFLKNAKKTCKPNNRYWIMEKIKDIMYNHQIFYFTHAKGNEIKNLKKNAEKCSRNQGRIQRGYATSQPVWDPIFLSQINKKLKILINLIFIWMNAPLTQCLTQLISA